MLKSRLETVLGGILVILAVGLAAVVLLKDRGGQSSATSNTVPPQSPPSDVAGVPVRKPVSGESEVKAKILAATVQVIDRAAGNFGSGVVVKSADQFVYILTANHLITSTASLQVVMPDSVVLSTPEVVARAADEDLALLRVPAEKWHLSELKLCPAKLVPGAIHFDAVIAGCSEKGGFVTSSVQVEERRQVRKSPKASPVWVWQTSVPQRRGMSGGAMVDRDGFLLGIASGTSDNKGFYTDCETIRSFLRANGLAD